MKLHKALPILASFSAEIPESIQIGKITPAVNTEQPHQIIPTMPPLVLDPNVLTALPLLSISIISAVVGVKLRTIKLSACHSQAKLLLGNNWQLELAFKLTNRKKD